MNKQLQQKGKNKSCAFGKLKWGVPVFNFHPPTPSLIKNDTIKKKKKNSTVDAPWVEIEKVSFLSVLQQAEARGGKASVGRQYLNLCGHRMRKQRA